MGTPTTERSLVLIKPDGMARGIAGRILQRFEDSMLKIVGIKMLTMDADATKRHYFDLEERRGSEAYRATAVFMQSGPVMALVLEGVGAVSKVRQLVGPTFPDVALPGTIRGDFAHQTLASSEVSGKAIANLIHASGNVEEAKYEVELWFSPAELFEYRIAAQDYAY